jgi:hypothetical protein
VSLLRCDCGSIVDTDDDPEAGEGACAFCRGEETYEQATERQARLYRIMGKSILDRSTKISRRTYNENR